MNRLYFCYFFDRSCCAPSSGFFLKTVTGGRFTNRKLSFIWIAAVLCFVLITGIGAADDWVGGLPLTTVQTGTVTGDLYISGNPPSTSYTKVVDRTFTLPAAAVADSGRVKWARLYISSYCGHMQDAKYITYTTRVDWNNDGTWDSTWTETDEGQLFTYMQEGDYGGGGNDNSEFAGHGTGEPYLMLNDHTNRVTSDYLSSYDVTNLIQVGQPTIKVNVNATGSYDGRIKLVELVVAYDDPSSTTETHYWINEGHDSCSYYTEENEETVAVGTTKFDTSGLSGITSATLIADYMSSTNGYYGFPTADNDFSALEKSGSFKNIELDRSSPDVQGPYSGIDSWDVTSSVANSNSVTFAYARYLPATGLAQFYKIPLAFLVVKKPLQSTPAPVADFTADVTSGTAPLTVKFTDASTGTVSSYAWDFNNDGTVDSTEQSPSYTYSAAGIYTVNLTVSNAGGSDSKVKTNYITATAAPTNDLSISGIVNPVPASAVFAREPNQVKVTNIKNTGTATLTNISLSLYASDVSDGKVPVNTTVIASIASGGTATVTLIDPTIRNLEGGTVTYTAVVDPENLIAETNEANNNKNSAAKPVKYNGYKGKGIYWEGGSNITTKHTYDLKGNLLYSTQPESAYKGVGWATRTETWSASDLPIPSGSTIEKVLLYFAYNWDQTPGGYPWLNLNFNGNILVNGNLSAGNENLYRDWSNFGSYADYEYGLCVYDVTDKFSSAGNSLVTDPYDSTYNKVALYPSTLVVVYSNPGETRKQIFINEECDELGLSAASYGTTPEEATAYAPFTGMTIDKANVKNAILYSFAGSAGPDEGNLLFNGNIVATNAWMGSSNTASPLVFNATNYITETGNEFGIQATASGGMDALQQILVVEYTKEPVAAPVADFTADVKSGTAPLTVKFTDASTGTISSYAWDFDNDGTVDSSEPSPLYTYASAGTYTVKLTVTGPGGSDDEVKSGYIMVSEPLPEPPVANFTANVTTGTSPLTVQFTDTSTGASTSWQWDFNNDGEVDSTEQNPVYTYKTAGTYAVNLTVANAGGSDSDVKKDYIVVTDISVSLPWQDSCDSAEGWKLTNCGLINTTVYEGEYSIGCNPLSKNAAAERTIQIPAGAKTLRFNAAAVTKAYAYNEWVKVYIDGVEKCSLPITTDGAADWNRYAIDLSGIAPGEHTFKVLAYWNTAGWDNIGFYIDNIWIIADEEVLSVINVTPSEAELSVGESTTFSADAYTQYREHLTDTTFTWSSSNESVGTINSNTGLFSALSGGTTNVNATAESVSGSVRVAVSGGSGGDKTPVANFTADVTSGNAPLTVNFTDQSTNSPLSWTWDFENDGTVDSTEQNPSYTYATAGTYTVNLTVTNAGGSDSEVKTDYIKVTKLPVPEPDLVVSSITPNAGEIFANEANSISAKVENSGSSAAGPFTVSFTVNGVGMNVTVDSLSAGANTTVSITDPTIRAYGDSVEVTVTADSENSVSESNEVNNVLSLIKTVVYNGYKGKRYTGGNDINTQATFEGKYGLVYSSGNTAYAAANWAAKTYTWSSTDLPIPEGAVIESARLYQPYTWNKMANDPAFTMSFNNNVVTPIATYKDQKSYGTFDYPSGLYVYNVTSLFDPAGNSITVTPEAGNTYGIYGAYLVVVYSDPAATEKKIWINDEFDLLASKDSYAVSSEEATAYALFSDVNATGVSKATAIAVLASGNDNSRSKFFFNDNEYTGFWPEYQITPQIGFSSYNVTEAIRSGTDVARIQSYDTGAGGDSMSAMNVILVAEYVGAGNETEVPVAAFRAAPTSGNAPLAVQFTDESTGSPASWAWDFNNDGVVDSTEQNPLFTYEKTGTYTVNLTVANAGGSDFEVKTDYISVSEPPTPTKPIASFTADVTSGTAPLTVNFTDQSTGTPTSWLWDFGDGASAVEQNASHTYASAGTYTVTLTVTSAGGSDSEIKTDYIAVSTPETPDTAKPVIESVVLFPANTTAGSTISISANITDNIGVTEVVAGQVQLKNTDGTWQGSITAPSSVGDYSLKITAKDAAGNTAETSVPYHVVQLSGGANIAVSPRASSVAAGNTVSISIKVKNTQNIDDTFKVRISVSELPASYQADLSWLNWTEKVVTLKAGEEALVPMEVTVPDGTAAGRKLFRANVNSETSSITGFDTGYLVIS